MKCLRFVNILPRPPPLPKLLLLGRPVPATTLDRACSKTLESPASSANYRQGQIPARTGRTGTQTKIGLHALESQGAK